MKQQDALSLVFQAAGYEFWKVGEPGVSYGEGNFPQERELIKAQLVVELMDRYQYPPSAIQVNHLVSFGDWAGYEEVDVLVVNTKGKPFMLLLVESPHVYEKKLEKAFSKLYALGEAADKNRTLAYLAYYTRWYEEGTLRRKESVVDFRDCPTRESWEKAGFPRMGFLPRCEGREL